MLIDLYIDGGSRKGFGACGWIVFVNKQCKTWDGEFLGKATSNEAEYWGLIKSIRDIKKMKFDSVRIYSDSKLIVNQIPGKWKVNYPHLEKLRQIALDELKTLLYWELKWIPREQNNEANWIVDYVFRGK